MAELGEEETLIDGRTIDSLRVVDLKQELKKRGSSIAGTKSQLADRLRAQLYLDELKQAPVVEGVPNKDIVDDEAVASNSFIQQYLKQQQELLKQRHVREPFQEEDKGVIPEGLANEVEELNQSLSRSQSEEGEKEVDQGSTKGNNNGEGDQMKDTEPSPQEPATSSRTSRRSRRHSAQREKETEETAETEHETRKSRRKQSKSRDCELDDEEKTSQDVEQMKTIQEQGKGDISASGKKQFEEDEAQIQKRMQSRELVIQVQKMKYGEKKEHDVKTSEMVAGDNNERKEEISQKDAYQQQLKENMETDVISVDKKKESPKKLEKEENKATKEQELVGDASADTVREPKVKAHFETTCQESTTKDQEQVDAGIPKQDTNAAESRVLRKEQEKERKGGSDEKMEVGQVLQDAPEQKEDAPKHKEDTVTVTEEVAVKGEKEEVIQKTGDTAELIITEKKMEVLKEKEDARNRVEEEKEEKTTKEKQENMKKSDHKRVKLVRTGMISQQNEDVPMQDEAAPLQKEDVLLQDGDAPVQKENVPKQQAENKTKELSSQVKGDAQMIATEEVTMKEEKREATQKKGDTAEPMSTENEQQMTEVSEEKEGAQKISVLAKVEQKEEKTKDIQKPDMEEKQEMKRSVSHKKVKLVRKGIIDLTRWKEMEKKEKLDEDVKTDDLQEKGVPDHKEAEKGCATGKTSDDAADKEPEHEAPEGSPRKRVAPQKTEESSVCTSKRRRTEADRPAGEHVQPEQSSTRKEEDTFAEDSTTTTMGKGEGKGITADAADVEEDGEIKEEGEAMEEGEVGSREKEEEKSKVEVERRPRSIPMTSNSAPVKTKRHSFTSTDKTGSKDAEQEDAAEGKASGSPGQASTAPVKKRRWGSTKKTADDKMKKSSFNISTDLLKGIIPEIKVAPSEILNLDQDEESMDAEEKEGGDEKKMEEGQVEDENADDEGAKKKFVRRTITHLVTEEDEEESDIDDDDDEEEATRNVQEKGDAGADDNDDKEDEDNNSNSEQVDEEGDSGDDEDGKKTKEEKKKDKADKTKENARKEVKAVDLTNKMNRLKTAVRTVIDEPVRGKREMSPAKKPQSTIIHVNNLVRPFTEKQLKELLGRYGSLAEGGFWINNVKSHCYATYESVEEALACREALHGTTWPSSNPKMLRVDFADTNELHRHMGIAIKEVKPEPVPTASPEPIQSRSGRVSDRDRERDAEQERRTRERERERERARKEREWDRGKERSLSRERRRRQRSEERKERIQDVKKEVEEPPAKLLDDLFRKTKATPCIYWLPLTEEQSREQVKLRAERAQERKDRRRVIEEEERCKREKQREERLKRERERDRDRPRERVRAASRNRDRRSRSRSKGRRR